MRTPPSFYYRLIGDPLANFIEPLGHAEKWFKRFFSAEPLENAKELIYRQNVYVVQNIFVPLKKCSYIIHIQVTIFYLVCWPYSRLNPNPDGWGRI
jgi:hypothetical protein